MNRISIHLVLLCCYRVTNHLLDPKYLLSLLRELHRRNTHLPALIAAVYFGAHSATDDLVAEADADETDSVLGQDFLNKLDEFYDPGRIVEGVLS